MNQYDEKIRRLAMDAAHDALLEAAVKTGAVDVHGVYTLLKETKISLRAEYRRVEVRWELIDDLTRQNINLQDKINRCHSIIAWLVAVLLGTLVWLVLAISV